MKNLAVFCSNVASFFNFSRKNALIACRYKKTPYICIRNQANGALAHLARALDWQSKGDEFESRMLHKLSKKH